MEWVMSIFALFVVFAQIRNATVMDRRTNHLIRIARSGLAVGALGVALQPIYHEDWPMVILLASMCLWHVADRRIVRVK